MAAELTVTFTDGGGTPLENAAVYAMPEQPSAASGSLHAEIDQRNRMFVPAVSVIQRGTSVDFPNSDNIRHQVYSFSPAKTFILKLYSGRPSHPVVFDQAGVVVLGCNIHDRMAAWVLVVDTPYFARSDARGVATIANLPAGNYTLQFWHPTQKAEVPAERKSLQANETVSRQVRIDAQPMVIGIHAQHDAASP